MSDYGGHESPRRWDGHGWSLGVASVLGVRIRFHFTLLLTLVAVAVFSFWFAVQGLVIAAMLFVMVLIHELGHGLVARTLGARVEDVVIWPLGGLTAPRVPQRALESSLIHFGGPAANLMVCLLTLPGLYLMGVLTPEIFNPFVVGHVWQGPSHLGSYLGMAFKASYWLLLANLLPLYPLDMGRICREMLAMHTSGYQATMIAAALGALGSLVLTGVALWHHHAWAALAAGFVAIVAARKCRELELIGDMQENEFGYDFSEGYTSLERSMSHAQGRSAPPSLRERVRGWMQQRKRRQGEMLEVELDRILAKIHDHGIASLTRTERKVLAMASRRRRR